jgi:two-component system sensor histidine kinase UhpB
MSHKPLRALLVEDSQDDADLILIALNEDGFDVVCERVETEDAMSSAINGRIWDVVISDFSLPRFSAINAMTILRKANLDIPFVIVSGCIGEESVVALMKDGVSDFVMKDKLARLAPVIKFELHNANMRREHQVAQDALKRNSALLSGITSALGEGIYVLDEEGRLTFMNPEAERLLGWMEAELLGQNIHNVIHGQNPNGTSLAEADCRIYKVLKTASIYKSEDEVFMRKDGSLIPVSITSSAIIENNKAVASVTAFQDISLRKQAEQELQEKRKQLQKLTMHLQTVREEERTKIARELHDELGQMLTGVKLDAKWLATALSGPQPLIQEKIISMSKLIDETLDAMRRVAADLRPVMLDDLGLEAALEWLTEEFGKRTGLHIQLELDRQAGQYECPELDDEIATAAYRIVQECLNNVARHARALHVHVLLRCREDMLLLRVSDDGQGITEIQKRNSFGIVGMRERATGLGGVLHISSIEGEGTCVEVSLPTHLSDATGDVQ